MVPSQSQRSCIGVRLDLMLFGNRWRRDREATDE